MVSQYYDRTRIRGMNMTKTNFTKHLKENQDRLIVFGTGEHGERMVKSLQQNDITPACFCDNNKEKIGKELESVRISSFEEVKKQYQNPIFLISPWAKNHQKDILAQVNSAPFDGVEYYTIGQFYRYIEKAYTKNQAEKFTLQTYKTKFFKTVDTSYTHIDAISITPTYKCTLRCRDCAAFHPFHENPKTFDANTIYAYIDRLDEVFDSIYTLSFVGGEALMHPNIFDFIVYAQTKPSIHKISLISNGTILPSKENLLRLDTEKVEFNISNYGDLSHKFSEFGE